MPAVAPPDLATIHERLLHLLTKAEAAQEQSKPSVPVGLRELLADLELLIEQLEDAWDIREVLKAHKTFCDSASGTIASCSLSTTMLIRWYSPGLGTGATHIVASS